MAIIWCIRIVWHRNDFFLWLGRNRLESDGLFHENSTFFLTRAGARSLFSIAIHVKYIPVFYSIQGDAIASGNIWQKREGEKKTYGDDGNNIQNDEQYEHISYLNWWTFSTADRLSILRLRVLFQFTYALSSTLGGKGEFSRIKRTRGGKKDENNENKTK